eukprot:8664701-Pyramimonas_sp.AAC.1
MPSPHAARLHAPRANAALQLKDRHAAATLPVPFSSLFKPCSATLRTGHARGKWRPRGLRLA